MMKSFLSLGSCQDLVLDFVRVDFPSHCGSYSWVEAFLVSQLDARGVLKYTP